MPEMDGFEVAKVLNSNPQTCYIPFLFVSSNQIEDRSIMEGFQKGAVDYLIKPINPTITRAKVAVFERLFFQQQQLKKTIVERDRVNAQLERYTKVMAHDLKTPLCGIIQLISLIRINERVQDIDDVLEELMLLETLSTNLSDMITSVLQDSKNTNENDEQMVSVSELIDKCISLLQPPASINFEIATDLPVFKTREIQLQQVFQNLIGNAIKYLNKPKGLITINSADSDGFYKFSIKDNGPGIDPKDITRIFEEFTTGSAHSIKDSSTGLGLHLIKNAIEEKGGRIWVQSILNEGSTFYFLWPK
jgi:signal transduction histidine kinase